MTRAHGIDISLWQGSFDPPEDRDDLNFVIVKASDGTAEDPKFESYLDPIRNVPIRGAYHYFRSDSPWKDQAEFFLNTVDDQAFHFYALDIEQKNNERSEQFAKDAEKWLRHVADATEAKVLYYTNPDTYKTWLDPFVDWMKDWPLWIAQYWLNPSPEKHPALPDGVEDWKLYQYSADGNLKGPDYGVESPSIDLDVFNGTVREMRVWLGLDDPMTEEEMDERLEDILLWAKENDLQGSLLRWAERKGFQAE